VSSPDQPSSSQSSANESESFGYMDGLSQPLIKGLDDQAPHGKEPAGKEPKAVKPG
jgi:hypothetical protein